MLKQPIIRSRGFRMFVASLPCIRCKVQGLSQAAHMKLYGQGARAMKVCDTQCRPLCADRPSVVGCHTKLDQHKDDYWTKERVLKALGIPLYEYWQEGNCYDAIGDIVRFK